MKQGVPYTLPSQREQEKKKKSSKTNTDETTVLNIPQPVERVVKINQDEKRQLIEEAKKEAIKELAKEEIKQIPKTRELMQMKDRELMRIKNVFPFDLFSDYLLIEENKITFIWSVFFFSKDIRSVLIRDIANINIETDLFFAKIEIIDQYFEQSPLNIFFLPKKEAMQAHRLIQGLISSIRDGVDLSQLTTDEIITSAMNLGVSDSKRDT